MDHEIQTRDGLRNNKTERQLSFSKRGSVIKRLVWHPKDSLILRSEKLIIPILKL